MELIKIRDLKGMHLATLQEGKIPQFVGECNYDFAELITSFYREGVPLFRDSYDSDKGAFIMKAERILANSPDFWPVLKTYLTKTGFTIIEETPEDKQIFDFLGDIPDDNPDKKEIIKKLPDMTRLEKSFLLSELKKEK